jgi:sigma-B regulation protein RsbU (phosphoserine phosphatase)
MGKCNTQSTTRLLKEMSQSSDPGELVRLFLDHVRQDIDVQRALVLSSAGLSAPQYRLVHNVACNEPTGSVATLNELHKAGLLAEILYLGEFQTIADFAPNTSDPGFDLLQGSRSLIAFPIFEKGISVGVVVMLGSSPQVHNDSELCALATTSSLLGRAIEAQKLANHLEVVRRALDSELKAAADVQRWLLPSLPRIDGIDIAASYRTARYSSGDYYDVGRLSDGRLGILIADVSGKGAPAAVLMAVLRSIVHDEVDRARPTGPAALLDYMDARLRAMGLPQRCVFITAFCGTLDVATGALVYSCAGHNPPRVLRTRDQTIVSLDGAKSLPLGLLDEPSMHAEETVLLMPGDIALFYTDGITEARSPTGEFFGEDRLDQILRELPGAVTPDAVVHAVTKETVRFEGDGTLADDQTVLALCRFAQQV